MNYNFSEITYPSKDGKHTIYAEIYTPKNRPSKGVIQVAHGMIDYVGRYEELADFLTGEGYIFAGNHHLGHGKSVSKPEDYGFFDGEGKGIDYVIADMHTMNRYLRDTFPALPLIVMGHSMGSFIARIYAVKHPHSMAGVVIHGTGGPNKLLPFGKLLTALMKKFKGQRHHSPFIENLAFGSYNKKFPKSEGNFAWLTREASLIGDREKDPYTNFSFTASGYSDLFKMSGMCNSADWFKNYPKEMPTLVISGDSDPVGNYGKGPDYVYKKLLISGVKRVDLKIYEGARHELFRETNRKEFFNDLLSWIESVI